MKRKAPSVEGRLFESLLRTADLLLRGETEVLKGVDLTFPQYNVLRILRGAGATGLSCGAISERMVTRDSDITRLLDRLEDRRLVTRARDEQDRRVIVARISRDGLDLLRRLDAPVDRSLEERLGHVRAGQLETLIDLLERIRSQPA